MTWEAAVLALRTRPEAADLVREAYFDDPLADAAARYHAGAEWTAVRPWLGPARGRALDIGAGRGIASYALAREGFAVTALEPDPSDVVGAGAIRGLARETRQAIEVVEAPSEAIPLADASIDLVLARAVLHHMRDLRAGLGEAFRVLQPGGRLLALREHVITRAQDLDAFLAGHPLHKDYGGEHAYTLGVYLEAIRAAGFRLEAVLAPLASAINYAPHTARDVRRLVAARAGPAAPLARAVLGVPGVWRLSLPLLTRLDRRPGRHYSFIAVRPR